MRYKLQLEIIVMRTITKETSQRAKLKLYGEAGKEHQLQLLNLKNDLYRGVRKAGFSV